MAKQRIRAAATAHSAEWSSSERPASPARSNSLQKSASHMKRREETSSSATNRGLTSKGVGHVLQRTRLMSENASTVCNSSKKRTPLATQEKKRKRRRRKKEHLSLTPKASSSSPPPGSSGSFCAAPAAERRRSPRPALKPAPAPAPEAPPRPRRTSD